MDIVVINLERSTDRRIHMTAMLRGAGLEFRFARAIDADTGEHLGFQQYDAAAARRAHGEELTPGEIACFASHHLLWHRSAETNRPLLVMEDDVVLGPPSRQPPRIRQAYDIAADAFRDFKVFSWEALQPGQSVEPPAMIEMVGTTYVLSEPYRCVMDTSRSLLLRASRSAGMPQ